MKALIHVMMICFLAGSSIAAAQSQNPQAGDSTGLAGDHFSLQGALEMFKQAGNPEEFEKKLNTKDNYVNNLDLNSDGKIDFVRVTDRIDKNMHAIVLTVDISESESQDIAVIEIEKTGSSSAMLQIVGDPDIYGDSAFVEPVDVEGNGNGKGPAALVNSLGLIVVNVWYWPCVRYIYEPVYVVYQPRWHFLYYPVWFSPWWPYSYSSFWGYNSVYWGPYRYVYYHRTYPVHQFYSPYRHYSPFVNRRYETARKNYYNYRQSHGYYQGRGNRQAAAVTRQAQNPDHSQRNIHQTPVQRQNNTVNPTRENKAQGQFNKQTTRQNTSPAGNRYETKPAGNNQGKVRQNYTKPSPRENTRVQPGRQQNQSGNFNSGNRTNNSGQGRQKTKPNANPTSTPAQKNHNPSQGGNKIIRR